MGAVVLRKKTRSPGRGFLAQGATVSGEAADVTDAILAGMPRELGQIDALARVDGADEARAIIVRAGRNPSHRIEPHRGVGALRSRAPSMDASSRRSIEQASWSCGAEGGILDRLPGLLAGGQATAVAVFARTPSSSSAGGGQLNRMPRLPDARPLPAQQWRHRGQLGERERRQDDPEKDEDCGTEPELERLHRDHLYRWNDGLMQLALRRNALSVLVIR